MVVQVITDLSSVEKIITVIKTCQIKKNKDIVEYILYQNIICFDPGWRYIFTRIHYLAEGQPASEPKKSWTKCLHVFLSKGLSTFQLPLPSLVGGSKTTGS